MHKRFASIIIPLIALAVAGSSFGISTPTANAYRGGEYGATCSTYASNITVLLGGTTSVYARGNAEDYSDFGSGNLTSEFFYISDPSGLISASYYGGQMNVKGLRAGSDTYTLEYDAYFDNGDDCEATDTATVTVEQGETIGLWNTPPAQVSSLGVCGYSSCPAAPYYFQPLGDGSYSPLISSTDVPCGVISTGTDNKGYNPMANEPIVCQISTQAQNSGFRWGDVGVHVDSDDDGGTLSCKSVNATGMMSTIAKWGKSSQTDIMDCGSMWGPSGISFTGKTTVLWPRNPGQEYLCPTDSIITGAVNSAQKNDSWAEVICSQVEFPEGSVAPPTGTITVHSYNSVTHQPVSDVPVKTPPVAWWSFTGSASNPCTSASVCSGNSETYSNQTAGSYTISPTTYLDDPLYSINPSSVESGYLNPGNTLPFTLSWDPLATLAVVTPSISLNISNGYSAQVTVKNTGPSGSVLNNLGATAPAGWLIAPSMSGASINSQASQNFTVRANPDPSCTSGCSTTLTFRGDSASGAININPPKISIPVTLTTPPPPTTVAVSSSPASIILGQSTNVSWTTGGNPTSCTASNDGSPSVFSGSVSSSGGSQTVTPLWVSSGWNFTVTCTGPGGTASATSNNVNVVAPTTVAVSASPTSIILGQSTNVTWSSGGNPTSCTASTNGTPSVFSGSVAGSGSRSVTPNYANPGWNFTVTCSGPGGTKSATSGNVNVSPQPTQVTLTPPASTIILGQSATLTWTTSGNPTSCTMSASPAEGDWSGTTADVNDSKSVTPSSAGNHAYTISCTGPGGTKTANATITVNPKTAATISADPTSLILGNPTTLTWSSTGNPTSCTASGDWSGNVPVNGSRSVTPGPAPRTYTYSISCTGPGGTSGLTSATVSAAAPIGTVVVQSINAQTGQPLASSWSFAGSIANPCTSAPCTGLSQTYANQPMGLYSLTPIVPAGYTLNGGSSIANQSLANNGDTVVFTVKYDPIPPPTPPSVSISAASSFLTRGNGDQLNWTSSNATACNANASPAEGDWSGSVDISGSKVILPETIGTHTYSITCTGPGGNADAQTTILVRDILTINPASVPELRVGVPQNFKASGGSGTGYAWTSPGANGTTIDPSTYVASYPAPGNYTVTLKDDDGHIAQASVSVVAPNCSFTASPTNIVPPQNVTLNWSCQNVTTCTLDGATVGTSGSASKQPTQNTTYTLSCSDGGSGAGSSVSQSQNITVNAPTIHEINP